MNDADAKRSFAAIWHSQTEFGNEALFEKLRQLRRQLADERNVPAYIVFSDTTLRHMAAAQPKSEAGFRALSGVGEKKLARLRRSVSRRDPRTLVTRSAVGGEESRPQLSEGARQLRGRCAPCPAR